MNAIHDRGRMRFAVLPELDPVAAEEVAGAWWPISRLGEGLDALARRAGLRDRSEFEALTPPPVFDADEDQALTDWFAWAGERLGLDVEPVEGPADRTREILHRAGPAVIMHSEVRGRGFLLVLAGAADRLLLLRPDLSVRKVRLESIRAALCWSSEAPLEPQISRLLEAAAVPSRRRERVKAAMIQERLAAAKVSGVWLLRLPAETGLWRQLRQAGAHTKVAGVLGVFAAVYALEILSWALMGGAALGGRLDFGWLIAWLLLILTLAPLQLAGRWLEATFALDTGRILKSRLLAGALRLDPERVIRQGVGHLIGRVMEAQALESLALNGGMSVLVGALELIFAALVLWRGAAGGLHLTLLAGVLAVTGVLAWRYWDRLSAWSAKRLALTNGLLEGMIGHRTRLAQERQGRRDAAEDKELLSYLDVSKAMDRSGVIVLASLPSIWILLGLGGLAPPLVSDAAPTAVALAVSLGGMLIAQRALAGISGGLASLTRAGVAWAQVANIVDRSAPTPAPRPFLSPRSLSGAGARAPLVAAHGLGFRYAPDSDDVISDVDVVVARGERVLLEGASGSGKSTLAGLLTGLKAPQSGLLLLNGLDRHTLGDDWRRLVTSAPQFHENHILSGPLAFNLLMGRRWPATDADLREAEALCEDLGLGDLLRRMPAGILQRVGETGWQLSHGERSRIFLARALLQNAELTILDESFAALDPVTLERCLATTFARSKALMVIAHP